MHSSFFNALDYLYILLLFVSCMMGFFKGFIKDFFGTCAWLGSGFITVFISPYCSIYLQNNQILTNPILAKIAAIFISFILILAMLHLIINKISNHIQNSCFSGIDRALGAFYGFIRGLLLLIIICGVVSMFNVIDPKSRFISDSKISVHLINLVNNIIPKLTTISKFKAHPTIFKNSTLETKQFSKRAVSPYKYGHPYQTENQSSLFRKLFDHLKTTSTQFFNKNLFSSDSSYNNHYKKSLSSTIRNSQKIKLKSSNKTTNKK